MARQLFGYGWRAFTLIYFLLAGAFFALFDDIALTGLLLLAFVFISSIPTEKFIDHPPSRSALRLLVLTCLMAICVVGFNYIVNPLGTFNHRWVEPIVLDSQEIKKDLYKADPEPADVVVLGSSRSFTVPPAHIEELTGLHSFNASVQAGNPTSYLEFARYLEAQGYFPQVIIVGLAVEQVVMSPNHSWLNDALQYIMTARESDQWMRKLGRVKQLFTIQTTSASLRALRTDAEREHQTYTFDADGLGHFTTTNSLDAEVNTMIEGSWNGFFDQLSVINPLRLEDLHDFLEICRAHDTVVIFYLPPYHSRLLASFEGQPYQQLYNDLMAQLAVWQEESSFTVYDFTDPATFGGNDQLFIDAIHPSEEAARLMLDSMLHDFEP